MKKLIILLTVLCVGCATKTSCGNGVAYKLYGKMGELYCEHNGNQVSKTLTPEAQASVNKVAAVAVTGAVVYYVAKNNKKGGGEYVTPIHQCSKYYTNTEGHAPCAENGSCYGDISEETNEPKTILVNGYNRTDGTYVCGYYRSK